MDQNNDDFYRFDVELSDRETFFIGKIVALWGALEHEVFTQTLIKICPVDAENAAVPKKMNNAQFSEVLKLWKSNILDKANGENAESLKQQYEEILRLSDFRNALIHGMWDWHRAKPAMISTVRVHKDKLIRTHFTVDDLANFCDRLGRLNFKIRYPGGAEDLVRERMEDGGFHISRRGASLMLGDPIAEELFLTPTSASKTSE